MTHSERIFSKTIEQVTYNDVEEYFREAKTENDFIEFKSYSNNIDAEIENIHKAMCAFLNSDGGLIIWGAPRGATPAGQDEKIFQGNLMPLNMVWSKDRMVNKVADKIIPLPQTFKLEVLPNPSNDASVCLIEINKSEYAPHQTRNIYYMRMDGQSRPAPHHYVEALFKQIRYPKIESYLKFSRCRIDTASILLDLEIFIFNFSPLQNETNVAFALTCIPGVFAGYQLNSTSPIYDMNGTQYRDHIKDTVAFGQPVSIPTVVRIPTAELAKSSGSVKFILSVVGKTSPVKLCEYELEFKSPITTTDLNPYIKKVNENQLMVDVHDAIPLSKAERLKVLLGRNVSGV